MPAPAAAIDAAVLRAWAAAGREALAAARSEIDELNVYPVPDGDTGTNLYLTVEAADEALADVGDDATARETLDALARGALLGARGNSGVILSQMLRGMADALPAAAAELDARALAAALTRGSAESYAAVGTPVEGTMLTVLREAAEAAEAAIAAADAGCSVLDVVRSAARRAAEALARTPDQLEVLARAGVVDAGGRGVCVLLDSLDAVVSHEAAPAPARPRAEAPGDGRSPRERVAASATGPGYEVMYLLDAPARQIAALRARLAELGDSLVVVGSEPTWNVHIHVDDVGAAVEAGVDAGRPHRIRVTNLRDALPEGVAAPEGATDGRGVVSVVAGDGLADLFEAAGATVVPGGPGRRASTAEVLSGIRGTGRHEVVVLPNDADSLAVAEAAAAQARDEGRRVAVVPTRATVQALAALAVHDGARRFEDDVVAMTAAAGHCRHGGVTVATRRAVTMAGVCEVGDVLGIVDGDFAVIGSDLAAVAGDVVDRMLGSGGELVTVVTGADGDAALAASVVAHVRAVRPEVDTVTYVGGQPGYPLLLGVE